MNKKVIVVIYKLVKWLLKRISYKAITDEMRSDCQKVVLKNVENMIACRYAASELRKDNHPEVALHFDSLADVLDGNNRMIERLVNQRSLED